MKSPKKDTHTRIIKAASRIISREGIDAITFQRLGDEIGLTHAAVYKHFSSKPDLFIACINQSVEVAREYVDSRIDAHAPAMIRFKRYIEVNLDWIFDLPKESYLISALQHLAILDPVAQRVLSLVNEGSLKRIEGYLRHACHERALQLEDPKASARAVHDLMMGESLKAVQQPKELTRAKRFAFAWANVQKLIGYSEASR
jgi:AcrR family transcriptional regulator